jgi:hypothetical protein
MNPTILYDLGHARLTELHRQAERDTLASAARRSRRQARRAAVAARRPAVLARWTHRLGRVPAS